MRVTPHQFLAGGLVLAGLSLVGDPPGLREAVSIPFTTTADGFVLIPATTDRTTSMHVILDTGAGIEIFAPSLVNRLGSVRAGTFTVIRMWGDRVDTPLYTIGELGVGPLDQRNVTVVSWDVLDQAHIDGIVSARYFRDQPFTLDFARKLVVLESAKSLARRKAQAHMSALALDDIHGVALDLVARFRLGNDSGDCEIDTGSPTSTINSRYLSAFHVDTTDSAVHKRETHTTARDTLRRYDTTVPALALATAPEVIQRHPHVAFANIIYDCVVGIDFWSGRAVTFDIPDRQLLVSDAEPAH